MVWWWNENKKVGIKIKKSRLWEKNVQREPLCEWKVIDGKGLPIAISIWIASPDAIRDCQLRILYSDMWTCHCPNRWFVQLKRWSYQLDYLLASERIGGQLVPGSSITVDLLPIQKNRSAIARNKWTPIPMGFGLIMFLEIRVAFSSLTPFASRMSAKFLKK